MPVGRTWGAHELVATIDTLVPNEAPGHPRMDIQRSRAHRLALRDGCRLAGTGTIYIKPDD